MLGFWRGGGKEEGSGVQVSLEYLRTLLAEVLIHVMHEAHVT